jgi:GDP-4-dehydro-6-deoxy-D-mannose reductase
MSFVPDCENKPELAMAINRDGARVVSEAFYRSIPRGLIVFASTAQVYSAPIGDEVIADEGRVLPWAEDRQLLPQNVYARSKLEGEAAVRDVAGALGRSAVVLRLFNHVHNTQSERFFLPSVYGQLLGFQRSSALNRKLVVGNLEIKRDIGSIQDLLSAFHAVLLNVDSVKGVEVFNICSGVAKGLDRLVRLLAARMGLEIEIEVDESRFRRGEPKVILGSHEKISALTGWTPSAVSEDVLLDAFLAKIEF